MELLSKLWKEVELNGSCYVYIGTGVHCIDGCNWVGDHMCEYCDGVESGRPCKPFHDKFASAELQWCAGHELPTLFVYLHGDYTGIEVEHCPKCGRKLNDLREMRRCKKCGAVKPISEFYQDRDRKRWHCKECVKERIRLSKEVLV